MRRGYYCRDCKILSESCKKALDNLELMRKQILNFCQQNFSVECQTSIVQFTDKRDSHQQQPIIAIDNRDQQDQPSFFVGNNKHQFEVDFKQQQNQLLVQRQIDEINNLTINNDAMRKLKETIALTDKRCPLYKIDWIKCSKKMWENQKKFQKQIDKQFNSVREYMKEDYKNVENGLNDVQQMFIEYSKRFEVDIIEKSNLRQKEKKCISEQTELEFDLKELKQQKQIKEKSYDQLEKQLQNTTRELEQSKQYNHTIKMQFINKEAEYDKHVDETQKLIKNLQDQSEISQSENYTRQNEIIIFFTSIVEQIQEIQKNAPKL